MWSTSAFSRREGTENTVRDASADLTVNTYQMGEGRGEGDYFSGSEVVIARVLKKQMFPKHECHSASAFKDAKSEVGG